MTTCLVVMYHYVRDAEATAYPGIRALTPADFNRQLDWLQRDHTVIRQDELEAAIASGAPLPRNAALLTFDDGFRDHYAAVLPALRSRGLTGVFFLTRDACGPSPRVLPVHKTHFLLAKLGAAACARAVLEECESALAGAGLAARRRVFGADQWEYAGERSVKNLLNYELPFEDSTRVLDVLFSRHIGDEAAFARELYLDDEQVREMARGGMAFGYHTKSHRMLSRLTPAEQQQEIADGAAWIQALSGQRTVSFCYPWGGPRTYTADTLEILAASGYSVAYNTVRRQADLQRDPRFELPRIDTRDLPPYTEGAPA